MADETTAPVAGNGTPASAEDSVAATTAARELLIKEGHQVLDSSAFHGIKTEAAAKANAEKEALAAKYDSLQAEHAKLTEKETARNNQGKSEAELHREQRNAWAETDKAKDTVLADAKKANTKLQARLDLERIQNKISILMPDAQSPEMAMMWAKDKLKKVLSTDDSGQLVWTDRGGVPHEGEAAKKMFTDWYAEDAQKHLRSSNVPGPVTSGAPAAPITQELQRPTYDLTKSSMENYEAGDAWDEKQRGRQVP